MVVTEASDGRQAWELLAASGTPPDLVLTDVVMPEMNGRQLGEAIHTRWPEVTVLYTSAYSEPDMRAHEMLPGDALFLQKPFTPQELVERVSELVLQARGAG
jgi:YesN/AraC family two-component response regulator